jgi:hypothetical protein
MQHFIIQCSCGNIIQQCRCPDSSKNITTVPYGCGNCHNVPVRVEAVAGGAMAAFCYRIYDEKGTEIITNQKGLEGLELQLNKILHGED